MMRLTLLFALTLSALAQQPPIETQIQAAYQARDQRLFEDVVTHREQARALLGTAPLDSPQFGTWAQQVSMLYRDAGLNAQSRGVLQDALARVTPLGNTTPARLLILSDLGHAWSLDGHLLNAVHYLELAAEVPDIDRYGDLAALYRQLGRPEAVTAVKAKVRAIPSPTPNELSAMAAFLEQYGTPTEAAETYHAIAAGSTDADTRSGAYNSLASLYVRRQQFAEAAAATREAIAALQSSDQPYLRDQAVETRIMLADYLRQGGRVDQGDEVYRQILLDSRGSGIELQVLRQYTGYLGDTGRAAQGESILKDYLNNHSGDDPLVKMGTLYSLSQLAQKAGNLQTAEQYQETAQALQPPPAPTSIELGVRHFFESASTAIKRQRFAEAHDLALHAIQIAPQAVDGMQLLWMLPTLAESLATQKQTALAISLFERLTTLAVSWPAGNAQSRIDVARAYANFLMHHTDTEALPAIERFRQTLLDANGAGSATLSSPLEMKIEYLRDRTLWDQAEASARELLDMQASFSGLTSEPYFNNLVTAAAVYQAAGDPAGALPLLRKAVAVADLLQSPASAWQRPQIRVTLARALAATGQFDEAEAAAHEAIAIQQADPSISPMSLNLVIPEIRRLRQTAASR